MFGMLALVSVLGIVVLNSGEEKQQNNPVPPKPEKYSREYCRANLAEWDFDNWNCHVIAEQLQDAWLREDLEYLLRNGYSFQLAVEEFVEKGKIKL